MKNPAKQFFLIYSTANDDPYYFIDFLNFTNMKKYAPGVHLIKVYIAVSKVREFSHHDEIRISKLIELLNDCSWLNVEKVIIKGNIGRDFSSIKVCLEEISRDAHFDDQVMVKNRSGYGPFSLNWFSVYYSQYLKLDTKGLIGSTINFCGHPQRPVAEPQTHVQTYVFFSEFGLLKPLIHDFPASRCTNRFDLIAEGEIGLSQYFISNNMKISSLFWPDRIFSKQYLIDESLPMDDIKKNVKKLPIRYKFKRYIMVNNPIGLFTWFFFCLFSIKKAVSPMQTIIIYKNGYDK